MKYKTKNKYLLLTAVSLLFFLISASEAKAVAPWLIYLGISAGLPLLLGALKAIFSITAFIALVSGVHFIAGKLITHGINFQTVILNPEKITVIQTVWGLIRDFVNIFFILILLIIAFATIFNKPTGYTAKDLLPKLIIAALLINFSLVIAAWTIDLLWIPASVFLKPLGQDLGGQIANVLNIQKFFDPGFIASLATGGLSKTIEWAFRMVLFIVEAFILLWIASIIWIRIPILIGLMIISPLAWLGLTLPAIKKQSWDNWWQKLFCWGAIPIPLFGLIYFVTLFNQRLSVEINQAIPASILTTALSFIGLNTSQAIVWLITVGLFLGGLMYIKGLSCSLYPWISSAAFGSWKGIRRGAGATVDFGYTATGAAGAVGRVQKEFKEGGIPIFGARRFGVAQREARETKVEDWLRTKAGLPSTFAAQRNTLDQAEKASKDIDNRFKQTKSTTEETAIIDELRAKVSAGAKDPETLAAINALAKKGQLDVTLFNQAVDNFKDMPLALTKVFSEWKEGKFGGIKADELIPILRDARTPLEAKRLGYNFVASDDGKRVIQDKSFDSAAFEVMYETLGGRNTKAGREAKKFVSEINPVVVGKYNNSNPTTEFDDPADYPTDEADAILKQIKKTGSKDFTKYNKEVWNDPDFKSALGDLLYNKATTNIGNARKYAEEVRKWLIRESKDEDELRIFNDAATMAGI